MRTARRLTVPELAQLLFLPPANAGSYWWGVPHHELATALIDAVSLRGWSVVDSMAIVSSDGREMFLTLAMIGGVPNYFLGVQASHNRQRSLKAFLGVQERDSILWLDKQTFGGRSQRGRLTGLPAAAVATEILLWFMKAVGKLPWQITRLQGISFTMPVVHKILAKAASGDPRHRCLPWSRAGQINKELGDTYAVSGWRLLTLMAHAARLNPPLQLPEQIYRFKQLLLGKES